MRKTKIIKRKKRNVMYAKIVGGRIGFLNVKTGKYEFSKKGKK